MKGNVYYEARIANRASKLLILKVAVITFIPYYWQFSIVTTSPGPQSITNSIGGIWSSLFSLFYNLDLIPTPYWYYNGFLFSLLCILPLIAFAFFFGDRPVNKRTILAAVFFVLLSFMVESFLKPPFYHPTWSVLSPYEVVPKVVSLAIFVFIFWPLLKNSWLQSLDSADTSEQKEGSSRQRDTLRELIPARTPLIVWLSMILLPELLTIANLYFSQLSTTYFFEFTSELWSGSYYSQLIWSVPGLFILNSSEILRIVATSSASSWTLSVWFSLLLGVTTLRFIRGKSTFKQVRILAAFLILLDILSDFVPLMISHVSITGYYLIPLPLFPIAMLIVAKLTHADVDKISTGDEMIHVPLRFRVLSKIKHKENSSETIEPEQSEDFDNDC